MRERFPSVLSLLSSYNMYYERKYVNVRVFEKLSLCLSFTGGYSPSGMWRLSQTAVIHYINSAHFLPILLF